MDKDYEVIREIGTVGERGKATLLLRYMRWQSKAEPCYDLRPWYHDPDMDGKERPLKGLCLSKDEAKKLGRLLVNVE